METLKTNSEGYNYKYTDLAGIHEYLGEMKYTYYQYIETIDGNDYVMTVPTIEGKELPARKGCRVVQGSLLGKSNPAQEQGSALTYARRYSLLMAFGLATEDDDAESLTKTPKAQSHPKNETESPRPITAPQNGEGNVCSKCGDEVTGKVAKYSKEKFGKVLCFDCQKLN